MNAKNVYKSNGICIIREFNWHEKLWCCWCMQQTQYDYDDVDHKKWGLIEMVNFRKKCFQFETRTIGGVKSMNLCITL